MQDLIALIALIITSTIAIWYRIGRLQTEVKHLHGKFRYLNRRINNLERHLKRE